MQGSIVFCSACMMLSLRKFTFAISSPDEFLVQYSCNAKRLQEFKQRFYIGSLVQVQGLISTYVLFADC